MSDLVGILALCIAAIAVFSFLAKKKKPQEIEKKHSNLTPALSLKYMDSWISMAASAHIEE